MQGTVDSTPVVTGHEVAAHEEHQDLRVLGLITFLCSEFLMFAGFFAVFLVFRGSAAEWPPKETEVELLLPAVNTLILVSSSWVINLGTKAIKNNDLAGMRKWFGITVAMGAVFLAGQVYEYMNLGYGLKTNLFSNCFYLTTGFHGLHVFIGLLLIMGVLWRSRRADHYSSLAHTGPEMAEIYWHFVDVVWIVLFSLIYLLTLIK
ncbi:heme-copper oxidase subunit III [Nodosilinea sp. E11]|uniref:cytochrome c oxidase subunit 3 n=1 Tax=Nodosilinea sp. E11 TaxID=3037479 RepID=UPI0029350D66|nr:heme-copper oxidase subunit III [Nodosilinea sp. E11]WOD41818.1 heme-copper oxidase subunit III [Nodosilinea sp. E11]